ncbi:MAG: YceI family protein [Candidatus Zixiibacteriota bacterium]
MSRLLSLLLFVGFAGSVACAAEYGVVTDPARDTVYFRSTAKLEFIEGKTNNIDGGFSFDPQNPTAPVTGQLRVDLRTLKTGIDMRDGHMRERHLHTDKYPHAYFELDSVSGLPSTLAVDSTYNLTANGFFYIHGHKRKIEAKLELRRKPGDSGADAIMVRTRFSLNLDEYKIPRPKALFLKLAETIDVEVIFTAYNNLAIPKLELPDWPEFK